MADLTGLLARARSCRQSVAGLSEALASEHERRAQLVGEMRSAGLPWRVITGALGISRGWAMEILANLPDPVELAEGPAEPAAAVGP